jgi:hypothetical protein
MQSRFKNSGFSRTARLLSLHHAKREIPPHEIDEIVIAQGNNDDEWEEPIIADRDKLQPKNLI